LPKVFDVVAPETEGLGSVRAVGATHAGGSIERRRIGTSQRASAPTTSNAAASGHQGATGDSASAVGNPFWLDDERNPAAAASGMKELPPGLDSIVVRCGTGSIATIAGAGARGAGAGAGFFTGRFRDDQRCLYQKPPQFATHGVEDDPDGVSFWKIKHGIRLTGMPSFGDSLSDQQIWTLAIFLKHMDKLPPAVQQAWQQVQNWRPTEMKPKAQK
jgi:hypothetical protein